VTTEKKKRNDRKEDKYFIESCDLLMVSKQFIEGTSTRRNNPLQKYTTNLSQGDNQVIFCQVITLLYRPLHLSYIGSNQAIIIFVISVHFLGEVEFLQYRLLFPIGLIAGHDHATQLKFQ